MPLEPHLPIWIGLGTGAILLVFYLVGWHFVGRDPDKGAVMVRHDVPPDLSPACTAFVLNNGFDWKCFLAAITSLLVKGSLRIVEKTRTIGTNVYLVETDDYPREHLTPSEAVLLEKLFAYEPEVHAAEQDGAVSEAYDAFAKALRTEHKHLFHRDNSRYLGVGNLATFFVVIVMFMLAELEVEAIEFSIILLTLQFVGYLMVGGMQHTLRKSWNNNQFTVGVTGLLMCLGYMWWTTSQLGSVPMDWLLIATILGLYAINFVFLHLMKAPTVRGQRLIEHLEGLREFLEITEEARMRVLGPTPEKATKEYDALLPYAVALGLTSPWINRLDSDLTLAMRESHPIVELYKEVTKKPKRRHKPLIAPKPGTE